MASSADALPGHPRDRSVRGFVRPEDLRHPDEAHARRLQIPHEPQQTLRRTEQASLVENERDEGAEADRSGLEQPAPDHVDPRERQRQQQARHAGRHRIEDLEAHDLAVEAVVGAGEPLLLLALRAMEANRAQRGQPLGEEMREVRHRLAHPAGPCFDGPAKGGRGGERQSEAEKAPECQRGREAEGDDGRDAEEEDVLDAAEDAVDEQALDARHVGAEARQEVAVTKRLDRLQRPFDAAREQRPRAVRRGHPPTAAHGPAATAWRGRGRARPARARLRQSSGSRRSRRGSRRRRRTPCRAAASRARRRRRRGSGRTTRRAARRLPAR